MNRKYRKYISLLVGSLFTIISYGSCATFEQPLSRIQEETSTPQSSSTHSECSRCLPDYLKLTRALLLSPSSTATDPWLPIKTAEAEGTRIEAIDKPLPTSYSLVTPTAMPGYSQWILDNKTVNPTSNTLIVFQYPNNQWREITATDSNYPGYENINSPLLVHSDLDMCMISRSFLSPPTWSSMEEENLMPWEKFPFIKTYLGEEGEVLFQVLRVGSSDIRITYSSSKQKMCQDDAMTVIDSFLIIKVSETPIP